MYPLILHWKFWISSDQKWSPELVLITLSFSLHQPEPGTTVILFDSFPSFFFPIFFFFYYSLIIQFISRVSALIWIFHPLFNFVCWRCDLVIFAGKSSEKLASGLLEPFLSHLNSARDQISKGGYSITLQPSANAPWFTKAILERSTLNHSCYQYSTFIITRLQFRYTHNFYSLTKKKKEWIHDPAF